MIKRRPDEFRWSVFESVVGAEKGNHLRFVGQKTVHQMDEPRIMLVGSESGERERVGV